LLNLKSDGGIMGPDIGDAVDQILEQAEKLSAGGKGRLINKLLSGSGLSVVLGNNHLSGSVIVQINMMGKDDLGEILHAIANRISKQGSA
jgi:hypothetical protein